MAEDKRHSWKEARQAERNRNLLMVLIPVILVILVAVIVLADNSSDDKEKTTTAASTETSANESIADGEETESADENETRGTAPEETLPEETADDEMPSSLLSKDAVPEINILIKKFLQARAACDAETIYQLYGRNGTSGLEEMRGKLLINARHIRSFENTICYTVEGIEERTWMVITLADIKMRSSSILVPIAMVSYVVQDDEAGFMLKDPESYSEDEQMHIESILTDKELIDLNAQVKSRLAAAVAADPQLEPIIAYLNADSQAWETGETEPETELDVQVLTE